MLVYINEVVLLFLRLVCGLLVNHTSYSYPILKMMKW